MRQISFLIAILALLQGMWLCLGEGLTLASALIGNLFGDRAESAEVSARIGMVRSDLWTFAAVAHTGDVLHWDASRAQAEETDKESRPFVATSLSLGPVQPGAWLLMAVGRPAGSASQAAALEMAYMTGGGEAELIPARLTRAARLPAMGSKTIEDFVALDIDFVLSKAPAMRPSLVAMYRASLPDNRELIIADVKTRDPSFVSVLTGTER